MSKRKTWLVITSTPDQEFKIVGCFVSKPDAETAAAKYTIDTGQTTVAFESMFGYEMLAPIRFVTIDAA